MRLTLGVISLISIVGASLAQAQQYPTKPIRMVVGFPPGGAADILGRIAAKSLSESLGQQVVVDNRGGASAAIATGIAARAAPDGYTLLFTSIPHVINPHLYGKVVYGYDAIKDFTPVVQFVAVPLMLAVHPSLPVKSVKELIEYAKTRPGQINYASGGSPNYLAMELFKSMAGIDMVHIPYKGAGPALTDLLAGQVRVTIASAVPLIPQTKAGKLRGLAVTGAKRSGAVPELPTIGETVPGYEVTNWFGVLAPAGTAKLIVSRINAELNNGVRSAELRKQLYAQGADPVGGTAEEFAAIIKNDFEKWAKVVKMSGAKAD
ncbi:MAG: tripartite tricarboxylate transporter substrate binding protein [Betaproteobacteria bacterium]|nr:tripartite tricarboxylate transporter substrate binding protein [Betaproteobacteria bacterium]